MRNAIEGVVVRAIVIQNGLAGIYIDGRARAGGEVRQGHPFAIEVVAGIGEQIKSIACGAAIMQRIRIGAPPERYLLELFLLRPWLRTSLAPRIISGVFHFYRRDLSDYLLQLQRAKPGPVSMAAGDPALCCFPCYRIHRDLRPALAETIVSNGEQPASAVSLKSQANSKSLPSPANTRYASPKTPDADVSLNPQAPPLIK